MVFHQKDTRGQPSDKFRIIASRSSKALGTFFYIKIRLKLRYKNIFVLQEIFSRILELEILLSLLSASSQKTISHILFVRDRDFHLYRYTLTRRVKNQSSKTIVKIAYYTTCYDIKCKGITFSLRRQYLPDRRYRRSLIDPGRFQG